MFWIKFLFSIGTYTVLIVCLLFFPPIESSTNIVSMPHNNNVIMEIWVILCTYIIYISQLKPCFWTEIHRKNWIFKLNSSLTCHIWCSNCNPFSFCMISKNVHTFPEMSILIVSALICISWFFSFIVLTGNNVNGIGSVHPAWQNI